jgi:hypothetical protein
MNSTRINIATYLEQIFHTTNLAIEPALLGNKHEFSFQGKKVVIQLPNLQSVSRSRGDDTSATWGYYRVIDGKDTPQQIKIHEIIVRVQLIERINVAPEMMTRPPNAFELMSEAEQSILNQTAEDAHEFAKEAFAHWTAVVRWVSRKFTIGRPFVSFGSIIHTPVLRVAENDHRIWAPPTVISVNGTPTLTQDIWDRAKENLNRSEPVPQYISLLQDAEYYAECNDYRRSIIEVAIACEIFLRQKVIESLPTTLSKNLSTAVEELNVSQYINKHFPALLSDAGQGEMKALKKDLTSLFDLRNKIMHMDNSERASAHECSRFCGMAWRLFSLINHIEIS